MNGRVWAAERTWLVRVQEARELVTISVVCASHVALLLLW